MPISTETISERRMNLRCTAECCLIPTADDVLRQPLKAERGKKAYEDAGGETGEI